MEAVPPRILITTFTHDFLPDFNIHANIPEVAYVFIYMEMRRGGEQWVSWHRADEGKSQRQVWTGIEKSHPLPAAKIEAGPAKAAACNYARYGPIVMHVKCGKNEFIFVKMGKYSVNTHFAFHRQCSAF